MPRRLAAAARHWWMARRAARELGRLDDRMLADCGVARCDIPHLADRAASGR